MGDPWQTTVGAHIPRTRCYYCGSEDIAAVCHECGVGICAEHRISLTDQPWYRSFPEFTDLNLERTKMGDRADHCRDCFHYAYTLEDLVPVGILIGVIGILILLLFTWRGLGTSLRGWFIIMLELTVVMLALLFTIFQAERQLSRRIPRLPVLGRFPELAVREYVGGQIQLDGGGAYHANVVSTRGHFDYTVRFANPDRGRRQLFGQKYGDRTPGNLHFNAGFLASKGPAQIAFQGPAAGRRREPSTLELTAPVSTVPFLTGISPQPGNRVIDPRWRIHNNYTFDLDSGLPVQLIPALVADGERVGLELLVQLAPWAAPGSQEAGVRVLKLEICAPQRLGPPRAWQPAAQLDPPATMCRAAEWAIVWENVSFTWGPQEDAPLAPLNTGSPYARFYMRFADDEDLRRHAIRGQLQVRLDKTLLSGLNEITLHYPLGGRRDEVTWTSLTDISVGFSLSLRQLPFRYPLVRVAAGRLEKPPGHGIIARLVALLNDSELYVKRVVENPPQISQASARLLRNVWQIDGRSYFRIYPIDFQLVVTGLETVDDGPVPDRSQMTFDLRVVATVSTPAMRAQVAQLRAEVLNIVRAL